MSFTDSTVIRHANLVGETILRAENDMSFTVARAEKLDTFIVKARLISKPGLAHCLRLCTDGALNVVELDKRLRSVFITLKAHLRDEKAKQESELP